MAEETPITKDQLNAVYWERNKLAMAFAAVARELGWPVGIRIDKDAPEWPVLCVDTPAGQVTWHIPGVQYLSGFPDYIGAWDGHSTPAKYERLDALITALK